INGMEETYNLYAKKAGLPPYSSLTVDPPSDGAQEALVFLLLRLQMAYSLKAARHSTGKHEYLDKGGPALFSGILVLARALYILWDTPHGNFDQLIRQEGSFDVLPCGLAGESSIWS